MRNTAEHPSWGEAVGEQVICDENGWVGAPSDPKRFLCTGGHAVGYQKFIRCISSYHNQDGPMSPGIAFMAAENRHRCSCPVCEYSRAMVIYEMALQSQIETEIAAAHERLERAHRALCDALPVPEEAP